MELDQGIKFHGHLCPMFYLGMRLGDLALQELGRDKEDGAKLLAQVEFRNCIADGIQYSCGTTYGKNNLVYLDHGKFAASFHDLLTDKKIRLKVKNSILEDTLTYGVRGQKVKSMPVNERQKEAVKLFKWGKGIVDELKKKSDADLFEIDAGEALKPAAESSLGFMICEECGEAVLEEFSESGKCRRCQKA